MAGSIEIGTEWINLMGAEISDINGDKSTFVLLDGDKVGIQARGSKRFGPVGFYIWKGVAPRTSNTDGSTLCTEGQQAIVTKTADDIWVRSMNGYTTINIEELT